MAQIDIIIGIGFVVFLLIYTAFKFKQFEEHKILQIAFILIALSLVVLIPKTYVNIDETCYPVISNSSVSGSFTEYEYSEFCATKDLNTSNSFYKTVLFVMRFVYVYVFMYFFLANYEFFKIIWVKFRRRLR